MSLQLQPDQLLAALENAKHPEFEIFKRQLMRLSEEMADAVIEKLGGLVRDDATWEYQMMCVPVRSDGTRMKIPGPLQGLDDEGWE